MMWFLVALVSYAGTCAASEGKVVGYDASGTRALVRYEHLEDQTPASLELAVLDLASGVEAKRFVILRPEDQGDAAVRSARWKAAEAEIGAMGIRVDVAIAPVPQTGNELLPTVALPDPAVKLRFLHVITSYDPPGPSRTLVAEVSRTGSPVRSHVLASWPPSAWARDVPVIDAVYVVPGGERLVVATSRCGEPALVHVVPIGP